MFLAMLNVNNVNFILVGNLTVMQQYRCFACNSKPNDDDDEIDYFSIR